jgi:hypothetical protein
VIETFSELTTRLAAASLVKRYDAYLDVDWDAHPIDPADPVWQLAPDEPLAATAWYRALPEATRARIGLHVICAHMRIGMEFENVLERGLLELAMSLPAGAPELRYAYHEIIEESQHSLMFQEFVARAGLEAPGLPTRLRALAARIAGLGRSFPELFFVFVLGGEDPIDHVQRRVLGSGRPVHPTLERVMKIHITEEARHLAFARAWLRARVPGLSPARRRALAVAAPGILAVMARLMMQPPRHVIATYAIPDAVVREAYQDNRAHRARMLEAVADVRDLLGELGVAPPRLWKVVGLA